MVTLPKFVGNQARSQFLKMLSFSVKLFTLLEKGGEGMVRFFASALTVVLVALMLLSCAAPLTNGKDARARGQVNDSLSAQFYSLNLLTRQEVRELFEGDLGEKVVPLFFGEDEIANQPLDPAKVIFVQTELGRTFDPESKQGAAHFIVSTLDYHGKAKSKFVTLNVKYDGQWVKRVTSVEPLNLSEEEEKELQSSVMANGYPDPFYRLITPGTTGNDVRFLQERLNEFLLEKGYNMQIKVDGIYGPETQSAVLRFCQHYALNYDGNFGVSKMNRLLSVTDGELDVVPSFSVDKIEYLTEPLVVGETETLRVTISRHSFTNIDYSFYVVAKSSAHGQLASALVKMEAGEKTKSFDLIVRFNAAGDFRTTVELYTTKFNKITERTGAYADTVRSNQTPTFTPKVTIGDMKYTTAPLVVNRTEKFQVTISEEGGRNLSRKFRVVVQSSAHGELAESLVTWAAGEVSKTLTFDVKFSKAGDFSTKVSVFTESGTLVAERWGSSKDTVYTSDPNQGPSIPSWARFYIHVDLWRDRSREGKLYLYDRSGNLRYTTRALGKSAYGYPWYERSGDTPTGGYEGVLAGPAEPSVSFGIGNVVELWGISGNAYRAYHEFGRSGIWIHGGRGVYTGYSGAYLYPTHGCVRIPDDAQVEMFGKGSSNLGVMGKIGVPFGGRGYVVVTEK